MVPAFLAPETARKQTNIRVLSGQDLTRVTVRPIKGTNTFGVQYVWLWKSKRALILVEETVSMECRSHTVCFYFPRKLDALIFIQN